ncbi:hypothetical protein [Chondromyces apiculatus]|uniref:Uncharacterized protein n=1 Tax=Chondromyces apiculatus DSM 436 TaxID=1192034 RepID=A0A017SU72_9BACT|nr:hypothetical protein [Chondromyces apiculatus]EYF00523.1 Hypothetical protein CAP_0505 [Chondromyces apiculatus DSM 436]
MVADTATQKLYWLHATPSERSLRAIGLTSGEAVILADLTGEEFSVFNSAVRNLAVDADGVYWTTIRSVMRANHDGTDLAVLASTPCPQPSPQLQQDHGYRTIFNDDILGDLMVVSKVAPRNRTFRGRYAHGNGACPCCRRWRPLRDATGAAGGPLASPTPTVGIADPNPPRPGPQWLGSRTPTMGVANSKPVQ